MNKVIAFIDSGVQDAQTLVGAMPAGTEVAFIHAGASGLAQMAAHLAGRQGMDSIHLISHGRPGGMLLAGEWITLESIEAQRAPLQAIGAALGEHGDFLIYGCEVAQGAAGQALVRQIAAMTRADIAASTTLTGAAELGGDWDLNAKVGNVQAKVLVGQDAGWAHVLMSILSTTPTLDLDAASDTGSSPTDNNTEDTTPTFSGMADHRLWVSPISLLRSYNCRGASSGLGAFGP